MKRHSRDRSQEDHTHENHERWLLTYADLITLLLGLFVILYAASSIDAEKYSALISALGGVFGQSASGIAPGHLGVVTPPMPQIEAERRQLEQELHRALPRDVASGAISVSLGERGVTIHIVEGMLFASGRAELKGVGVLDTIAGMLKSIPNDIRVEGHTDNVPIHTALFPSNWHLSVARALNAGYYLIEKHELPAERVAIVGFSEYRPLFPNTNATNRARNRRVDIVIVTNTAGQKNTMQKSTQRKVEG